MSAVTEQRDRLVTLLRGMTGWRVYSDQLTPIDPPAIMVSLPQLQWNGMCQYPTDATFNLVCVVKFDDRAADRLLDAVTAVSDVMESSDEFVITDGQPTIISSAGADLPGYQFSVQCGLSF